MFLTWLMFLVAISLSAVAAFYSIVGLAAIFSAAVIPIVIMGTMLEVAKLTVTVWLHEYWRECKWIMKAYLVPAVAVLMVITSMGIFGFLSKAHIDQIIPTGDRSAQIALFDERIANERAVIENSRSLIKQMDDTVNGIIAKGESREIKLRDGGTVNRSPAELALQVRRSQARERDELTKTIEAAQSKIVALQEERAPIAKEVRGLEAEVGPIKYVAALIYGDNPDTNLLERAVRWVIIILVAVFDPLAVMMLLAATESRSWYLARNKKDVPNDTLVPPEPDVVHDADPDSPRDPEPESDAVEPHVPTVVPERPAYLDRGGFGFQNLTPMVASASGPVKPAVEQSAETSALDIDTERPGDYVDLDEAPMMSIESDADIIDQQTDIRIKEAMRQWKADNPHRTLKEQRHKLANGTIKQLPWMALMADNLPANSNTSGFGTSFPGSAIKGDIFVRVDRLPNQVFKFNGQEWIQIDKNLSDHYTYNEAYLDHLILQLESGEYDPELLNETEARQIENRLKQRQDDARG